MRRLVFIGAAPLMLAGCAEMPKLGLPASWSEWSIADYFRPQQATPTTPTAKPQTKAPLPAPHVPEVGTLAMQDEATVRSEYRCQNKTLPFIVLERNEISTSVVQAGEQFRHRFVYALCPLAGSQPVNVTLSRTVIYKGSTVLRDTTKDFALQPGRSAVSALITVPAQAKPGAYELRLGLNRPEGTVEGAVPFVVQRKR